MKKYSLKYTFLFAFFVLGLIACTKTKRDDLVRPANGNIMQILERDAKYSTLVAALKRTELDKQLASVGPYTLFAPTNDAFTATLGSTNIESVPLPTLTRILRYHIYGFRATSGTFIPGVSSIATLNGFTTNDNVYVSFVPSISDEAPTNEGYINKNVYSYIGCLGSFSINGIKITTPDIAATNGIVHEVPRVVLPPTQNLYEYIIANPNLSRLRRAVDRVGAGSLLSQGNYDCNTPGCGAYTAFLPNNAAFAAAGLPDDASIDATSIPVLQNILLYHLISPANYSGSPAFGTAAASRQRFVFPSSVIANGQIFLTLSAPALNLRLKATVSSSGDITLNSTRPRTVDLFGVAGLNGNANNARVTTSDIVLTNGIAHIVDRMLDPTPQP
jgi:uncharacterized surface protein with fasciclin (FAS1) repeats